MENRVDEALRMYSQGTQYLMRISKPDFFILLVVQIRLFLYPCNNI